MNDEELIMKDDEELIMKDEEELITKCEELFLTVVGNIEKESCKMLPLKKWVERAVMLAAIHRLLRTNKVCTKRDVYYEHKRLFETQRASNAALEWAARKLQVPRNELRVLASKRGLVVGCLTWRERGQLVDIAHFGRQGHLIPASIKLEVTHIQIPFSSSSFSSSSSSFSFSSSSSSFSSSSFSSVRAVLYVEKETVLFQLAAADVHLTHSLLLVTGKGFSDLGTRELLATLSLSLPVLGLVDADPYGISILATLLGSKRRNDCLLRSKAVVWLGLRPSQLLAAFDPLAPSPSALFLELQPADRVRCRGLLESPAIPQDWKDEIQLMLAHNIKAEIEILDAIDTNFLVHHYLPQVLKQILG